MRINLILIVITSLALFLQCSKTDVISGTGTLIGNPSAVVTGSLFYQNKSPASMITVHLRKQNSLAFNTETNSLKPLTDTMSVITDNNGVFAFDTSLDSGIYVIEALSGNNSVFIDSVSIPGKTSTITVPPDTLRPSGAIQGNIKLTGEDEPGKCYVLVFGTDRFVQVQSDGSFVFYPLAKGTYSLRIITILENYAMLDTSDITVESSDTTDLGVLRLPYSGIPSPENVVLSYDTTKQQVILHWSVPSSAGAKSFNVYRSFCNQKDSLLNTTPVLVDSFIDQSVIQDQCYCYRIAVVDTLDSEGPKSAYVNVTITSAFTNITNVALGEKTFGDIDFAVDDNENFWIADFSINKVQNYDLRGNLLAEWDLPLIDGHPQVVLDSLKNVYLKIEAYKGSVQKYDSSGTKSQLFGDTGLILYNIGVETNGALYCKFTRNIESIRGNYQGYIYKYNPDGTFNKFWKINSCDVMEGILVQNGKVYCAGIQDYTPSPPINRKPNDNIIDIFDTSGTHLSTLHVENSGEIANSLINAIAIDTSGILYCSESSMGTIRMYDQDLRYIGKFSTGYGLIKTLKVLKDGTIVTLESNTVLKKSTIHFFRRR